MYSKTRRRADETAPESKGAPKRSDPSPHDRFVLHTSIGKTPGRPDRDPPRCEPPRMATRIPEVGYAIELPPVAPSLREDRAAAPKSDALLLVRVCFARRPVGHVRNPAGMRRCQSTREACDGEIEAAPKEMDGARFAEEAGTKHLAEPIRLQQYAPKARGVSLIVGSVDLVFVEGYCSRDLVGSFVDRNMEIERAQQLRDAAIEIGDGHRLEPQTRPFAAAAGDAQRMVDEVEVDLKKTVDSVRHRRRREPARRHVERDVPPVVDQRFLLEADLSDDLRPQVKGVECLLPPRVSEFRPAFHR